MKTTRKILSLVLAVFMTLALAIPALADDPTYTITVTNATIGHTYEAYKIFDATVGSGAVSYKYDDTLPANDYFVQDTEGYITVGSSATDTNGQLTQAAVAWIKENLVSSTAIATVFATADTVTLDVSDGGAGYYYITSTLGTAVTVNTAKPNVNVVDKNQKPSWDNRTPNPTGSGSIDNGKVIVLADGTKVTQNSANYGDVVNFDIGINATNFDGTKMITYYYITDKLGAGFTLIENSIDVKVNSDSILSDCKYDANVESGAIDVVITWINSTATEVTSKYANLSQIHVSYSATVTSSAVLGAAGNPNTANFTYDVIDKDYNPDVPPTPDDVEDPKDPTDDDTTNDPEYPEDSKKETKTYVHAIGIYKKNEDGPLAGAKFKLYTDSSATESSAISFTVASSGVYEYSKNGPVSEVESPADGKILLKGLAAGTYYLFETEAPEGYNKISAPVTYVIAEGTDANASSVSFGSPVGAASDVLNSTGAELPSTGGIGTTLFITFGMIAMLGAGVFLVTNKRMSKEGF